MQGEKEPVLKELMVKETMTIGHQVLKQQLRTVCQAPDTLKAAQSK